MRRSRKTCAAVGQRLGRVGLYLLVAAGTLSASPAERSLTEGAVDYRCDQLRLSQKASHQVRCAGNVIVRRGPWWLCCDHAVGEADAAWQWQALRCRGRIRVRHNDETMWADAADFEASSGRLVLSGAPVLQRGQSVLRGRRIIIDTHSQGAQIEAPQGSLLIAELKAATLDGPAGDSNTPLPAICPLPAERP